MRPLPTLLILLAIAVGCGSTDADPGSGSGGGGGEAGNGGGSDEWVWDIPETVPLPRVPEDNPMSVPKVELGRFLFYDTKLSGNQTQSCGSCHQQELAFTDALALAEGSTGEIHPRSSMSIANVAYAASLTWANDVLVRLERQALVPMFGEDPSSSASPASKTS